MARTLLEARWAGRRLNKLSVRSLNLGDKVAEARVHHCISTHVKSFLCLLVRLYIVAHEESSKCRTRAGLQETFAPRANDYLRVSPSPHSHKQHRHFAMAHEYAYEIAQSTLGNGHTYIVNFIVDSVEVNECNRVRIHLFTIPRDGLELYIHPYAEGGSLPPGLDTFQIESLAFEEVKRRYPRETEDTDTDLSRIDETALSVASMQASTS